MVSVEGLEERLKDDYETILQVLVQLGFDEDRIKYKPGQHLISAPRPEEGADNPNGCLIYINSLCVIFTTRAWTGNIFSLVMKIKDVSFPKALSLIAEWIEYEDTDVETVEQFENEFYKHLSHSKDKDYPLDFTIHKETELPPADSLSRKFSLDGVGTSVQEEWGVRYDHEEDAILIPIRDYSGNLVGCKARNNDPNCEPDKRFWAYIPYPKASVVYGWHENFRNIAEKQTVIVVESEKGVLQAASFGCGIAVGIGGHNISATQAKYIKLLGAKVIIIAFDEGIPEEEIRNECLKVKSGFLDNRVKYIFDRENIILPKGSKSSPVDYGSAGLKKLMKNCLYEVRDGESGR